MRRRLQDLTLVLGLFTVSAAACSGKVTSGTTAAPLPIEQYCDRYATEFCSVIVGCCGQNGTTPVDPVACKTETLRDCQRIVERSRTGSATYDPATAGACIGAIRPAFSSCAPRSDDSAYAAAEQSCTSVFRGTVPVGGKCTSSSECAIPAGGEVSCVYTSTSATCASRIPVGGTCGTSAGSCVRSAYCDQPTSKCIAKKPEGAACASDSECAGGDCVGNACRAETLDIAELCRDFGQDVPPTVSDAGGPAPTDAGP